MYFNMPTLVFQEKDCVIHHAKDIAKLGNRAFIITGGHSSRVNGALADVEQALSEEEIVYEIFDGIEENPSVETVMKARDFGLEKGVDFVIGIGGGSPIDAAKAVAIMIANPEKSAEYLYEQQDTDELKALSVIAVPTTCGTGSEVTGVAVLTVHSKRTKASLPHRVFPKLALLDEKYLNFAPAHIIRATAIDALGHLIESYINTNATDYSRMFVREGLRIWGKSKDILVGKREPSQEDYRNLLNASTMGGMAIAHTGTTLPHSLSYTITYELGVAHGIAIGYFLAGYLREAAEADREYILKETGFCSVTEFENFYRQATGCESLPKEKISEAVDLVSKNHAKLALCPFYVDREVLARIAGL